MLHLQNQSCTAERRIACNKAGSFTGIPAWWLFSSGIQALHCIVYSEIKGIYFRKIGVFRSGVFHHHHHSTSLTEIKLDYYRIFWQNLFRNFNSRKIKQGQHIGATVARLV
jgi:hypothetical protein